jgi:hypothetical protein
MAFAWTSFLIGFSWENASQSATSTTAFATRLMKKTSRNIEVNITTSTTSYAVTSRSSQRPPTDISSDLDGHFLGPDVPWKGNAADFNPVWPWDMYCYQQACRRLGKPFAVTPEDFPADVWLTKEEASEFGQRRRGPTPHDFLDRALQMRLEKDRKGKLPPLFDRKCSYGSSTCKGPWDRGRHHRPCEWCLRERNERVRIHPEEDVEVVSFASELSTSVDQWGLQDRGRADLPKFDPDVIPPAAPTTAQPPKSAEPLSFNAAAQPKNRPRRTATSRVRKTKVILSGDACQWQQSFARVAAEEPGLSEARSAKSNGTCGSAIPRHENRLYPRQTR